jgi:hypothetical protein
VLQWQRIHGIRPDSTLFQFSEEQDHQSEISTENTHFLIKYWSVPRWYWWFDSIESLVYQSGANEAIVTSFIRSINRTRDLNPVNVGTWAPSDTNHPSVIEHLHHHTKRNVMMPVIEPSWLPIAPTAIEISGTSTIQSKIQAILWAWRHRASDRPISVLNLLIDVHWTAVATACLWQWYYHLHRRDTSIIIALAILRRNRTPSWDALQAPTIAILSSIWPSHHCLTAILVLWLLWILVSVGISGSIVQLRYHGASIRYIVHTVNRRSNPRLYSQATKGLFVMVMLWSGKWFLSCLLARSKPMRVRPKVRGSNPARDGPTDRNRRQLATIRWFRDWTGVEPTFKQQRVLSFHSDRARSGFGVTPIVDTDEYW